MLFYMDTAEIYHTNKQDAVAVSGIQCNHGIITAAGLPKVLSLLE